MDYKERIEIIKKINEIDEMIRFGKWFQKSKLYGLLDEYCGDGYKWKHDIYLKIVDELKNPDYHMSLKNYGYEKCDIGFVFDSNYFRYEGSWFIFYNPENKFDFEDDFKHLLNDKKKLLRTLKMKGVNL